MPASKTGSHISAALADGFVYIPKTGTYVAADKARSGDGGIITGVSWYDAVEAARELGLYLASPGELAESRSYFEKNPYRKFRGRTGKGIARGYISGPFEMTGSALSFRGGHGDPPDTYDLLRGAGFDGRVALIDHPWVLREGDRRIFMPSPRLRIRDVTEIGGKPFPRRMGCVQGYDPDTGLVTAVGPDPSLRFHGARYCVHPTGTKIVVRGSYNPDACPGRDFNTFAIWGPSHSNREVSFRMSRAEHGARSPRPFE
jgi:hypothetical protein